MVPTSGSISMSGVLNALGAPQTTSLGQLLKGSKNVPDGIKNNLNIPTIPPISLGDFPGAQSMLYGCPVQAGLQGAYFGETFENSIWYDTSGNNNNATSSGTIRVNKNGLNGYTYLSGTTSSIITFNANILPLVYTSFHVTRYWGTTNRGRIYSSTNNNWVSGHHNARAGVAYHGAWITPDSSTPGYRNSENKTWILSVDKKSLYRCNGTILGTATGNNHANPLVINPGIFGETSNWQTACCLVYNIELTDKQIKQVEMWLASRYGLINCSGLLSSIYTGYMNDTVNFFDSATRIERVQTTSGFNSMSLTNGDPLSTTFAATTSIELLGLFCARETGTHTFYLDSDDCSYFWIGATASTGYTTVNSPLSKPGNHAMLGFSQYSISLTVGFFYPIRIQYGNNGGEGDLQFRFATPAVSTTHRLSDHFIPGGLKYTTFNEFCGEWSGPLFETPGAITSVGITTSGGNLSAMTNEYLTQNAVTNISVEITGYFVSPTTEVYTFFINSDDCSFLWIGDGAIFKANTLANAFINNGGYHGMREYSNTFAATANVKYPIRIQYGQGGGGGDLQFQFSSPTKTKTSDLRGYFYADKMDFNDSFAFLDNTSTKGLVGAYYGESYTNGIWHDVSGNGNHAVSKNNILSEINSSDISNFTALRGLSTSTMRFPVGILPTNYTLIHITRYANASSNRTRIYSSSSQNWLSGHWNGRSGIAFHNNWITQSSIDFQNNSNGINWLLSIDTKNSYRANGFPMTTTNNGPGISISDLSINLNPYAENSDFLTCMVLVYNYELSDLEMEQIDGAISIKHELQLTVVPSVLNISIYMTAIVVYPNTSSTAINLDYDPTTYYYGPQFGNDLRNTITSVWMRANRFIENTNSADWNTLMIKVINTIDDSVLFEERNSSYNYTPGVSSNGTVSDYYKNLPQWYTSLSRGSALRLLIRGNSPFYTIPNYTTGNAGADTFLEYASAVFCTIM